MNTYLITESTTDIGKKIIAEVMRKRDNVSFIFPVRDVHMARKEILYQVNGTKDVNMIFCECPRGTEDATLDRFSFQSRLTQIIACPLEFEHNIHDSIIDKTRKINKSAINIMELAKKYVPQNVLFLSKNDTDADLDRARQFAVHYCRLYEKEYAVNNIYLNIEDNNVFDFII